MIKNIDMQPVDSSQILAVGHDSETNTLAIQFKTYKGAPGSVYHYANFTADDFEAFMGAASLGAYFGQNIKKETVKYPFVKVADAPKVAPCCAHDDEGLSVSELIGGDS